MRRAWLGVAVISVLCAYWLFRTPNPATAPSLTDPTPNESVVAKSSQQEVGVTPLPLQKKSAPQTMIAEAPHDTDQSSTRYSRIPKNNVVEFRITEGLAVAYGDTILGEPPPGFDQPKGFADLNRPQLWNRGEIPYFIQPTVPQPERIEKAIQMFHSRTGVKFVPYSNEKDAIVFTKGKENCASYLGRTGGLQPILLADRCGPAEIAHEIMHALGFVHEHSRTDRDQYIDVFWDQIKPEYQLQYAIVPESAMEIYAGSAFDPASIMMYEPHAFAVTPESETMRLKSGGTIHREPTGLSEADVDRVNRLYKN